MLKLMGKKIFTIFTLIFVYLNLWLIVKIYLKMRKAKAVFHQANLGEILLHAFLDYFSTMIVIVIDF